MSWKLTLQVDEALYSFTADDESEDGPSAIAAEMAEALLALQRHIVNTGYRKDAFEAVEQFADRLMGEWTKETEDLDWEYEPWFQAIFDKEAAE